MDLRVGETDYKDFKKSYGYRPKADPEVVKNVFYSIFSTTKNWKNYRGSGVIPADDLEERIGDIEMEDKKNRSFLDFVKTSYEIAEPKFPISRVKPDARYRLKKADLKRYRRLRKSEANVQKAVDEFLRNVRPKGIDPKKTLQKQTFSELHWTEGDKIEDVLARIQHKRLRKGGRKT